MKNVIFKMYQDISIGNNEICNECNKDGDMERPLSIYYIGEKFEDGDSIFFVGKTAVGGESIGEVIANSFTDATDFGEESIDGEEENSIVRAFYSYTHAIIESYYGDYETGKKFIALSNIVKCNNGTTNDTTSNSVKDFCINKLGVIWKEVELLSPKRVIFYTYKEYDNFIDSFRPKNCVRFEDLSNKNIKIGNKNCLWWHRRFFDKEDVIICDFLRLNHPQRMYKDDYVDSVLDWLNETKSKNL